MVFFIKIPLSVKSGRGGSIALVCSTNTCCSVHGDVALGGVAAAAAGQGAVFGVIQVLEQDPRPHYQDDPERIYGFPFTGKEIKFKVAGNTLTVVSID